MIQRVFEHCPYSAARLRTSAAASRS